LAFERFLAELAVECLSKPEDRKEWAAAAEEHLAAKKRELLAERKPQRKPRQPGKPRRPSIKTMIEQAGKAGKPLASITMPDGTKLDFGKPESAAADDDVESWLSKQKRH
jgi:hypothetical protein